VNGPRAVLAGSLALLLAGAAAAQPGTVIVVPLEGRDSAPDSAWIAHAVAEFLPRDLAFLGVAAIDGDERRRALAALEIPNAPMTLASSIRVAEALSAQRLVTGHYRAAGGTVELSLRLMDVERGTLSAPLFASGRVEALRDLLRGLAWDIALAGPTRPARTRQELRGRDASVPFPALRAYSEAQRPGDAPARIKLLRHALGLAPGWDDAELSLGLLLLQTREFGPALESLNQVAPEGPGGRRARFLQGVALYELGRYQEAAGRFSALARESPGAAVLNNHALALLRAALQGARGAAVVPSATLARGGRPSQVLRAAAELEPDAADVLFNLGLALYCEGDDAAAAFFLRGRVASAPGDVHARVVLSWALGRAGQAAEAEAVWQSVAALAPGYEGLAAADVGRRFERLRLSETAPALAKEARSDAELAATHAARGERLLEAGDAATALAELTRAAYLDPYGARIHRLLARAQRARGDHEKAVTELRMSLWCRDDAAVRVELGALLLDLGRADEARREVEGVLAAEPAHAGARALLERLNARRAR
jgi:tetratricopeptide (TPR) repeat protein